MIHTDQEDGPSRVISLLACSKVSTRYNINLVKKQQVRAAQKDSLSAETKPRMKQFYAHKKQDHCNILM